jgi:hypothetical protein
MKQVLRKVKKINFVATKQQTHNITFVQGGLTCKLGAICF